MHFQHVATSSGSKQIGSKQATGLQKGKKWAARRIDHGANTSKYCHMCSGSCIPVIIKVKSKVIISSALVTVVCFLIGVI